MAAILTHSPAFLVNGSGSLLSAMDQRRSIALRIWLVRVSQSRGVRAIQIFGRIVAFPHTASQIALFQCDGGLCDSWLRGSESATILRGLGVRPRASTHHLPMNDEEMFP